MIIGEYRNNGDGGCAARSDVTNEIALRQAEINVGISFYAQRRQLSDLSQRCHRFTVPRVLMFPSRSVQGPPLEPSCSDPVI